MRYWVAYGSTAVPTQQLRAELSVWVKAPAMPGVRAVQAAP